MDGDRVDFFVSHAGADHGWAEWVSWQLVEAGYTVELDVWDWAAGQDFITKISGALDRCERVVALWSVEYFSPARYTTQEWSGALVHVPGAKTGRLVPVRVEDVPGGLVPAILRPLVYRDLFGLAEDQAVRVLLEAVRGPARPGKPPAFPGTGGVGQIAGAAPRFPGTEPRGGSARLVTRAAQVTSEPASNGESSGSDRAPNSAAPVVSEHEEATVEPSGGSIRAAWPRCRWRVAVPAAAAVIVAAVVLAALLPPDSGTGPAALPANAVRVYSGGSYGFSVPIAIAADGTHIWVANYKGNSVTEMNASNGRRVRTLSGGSYGFNGPLAIAVDGTHVWVVNDVGDSVTELNASDGSLVQVLSRASYGFSHPWAIAADSTHIWVTNDTGNSVTELNASDGSWVRTRSRARYRFNHPRRIAVYGTHVWVTNRDGNSVTELNASNASLVQVLSRASYRFAGPIGITTDGTHIWVANSSGKSVTELNASNASLVQILSRASYRFNYPDGIAVDGTHLWVASAAGNSVTVLPAG